MSEITIFVASWCTVDEIADIEDDMWDCEGFASMQLCVDRDLCDCIETAFACIVDDYAGMHDPDDDDMPAPDKLSHDTQPTNMCGNRYTYSVKLDGKYHGAIVVHELTV